MELKYTSTTCHFRPITVPWSPQTTMPSPYNIRDKTVPAHFCHIVKKKSTVKARSQDIGLNFVQHLPTKGTNTREFVGKSASIPVKRASTCSTSNRHHFAPTSYVKPYLGLYDPDSVINTIAGSSAHAIPKSRLLHCGGGIVYPSPEIGQACSSENPTLKIEWGQNRSRGPEQNERRPSPVQPQHFQTLRQPARSLLHRSLSSPVSERGRFDSPARRLQSGRSISSNLVPYGSHSTSPEFTPRQTPPCSPKDVTQVVSPHQPMPSTSETPTSPVTEVRRIEKRSQDGFVQPLKKRLYRAPEEPAEPSASQFSSGSSSSVPKPQEPRLRVKTDLCERLPPHEVATKNLTNPLEIRIEVKQNSATQVIFEKPVQIQSLMRRPRLPSLTSRDTERGTPPMVKIHSLPKPLHLHEKLILSPTSKSGCPDQKANICRERADKLRNTLLSVMHALLGPKKMQALGYPSKTADEMLIEVLHRADLAPKRGITYTCLRENTQLFLSLLISDKNDAEKRGWEKLDPEDILEEIYIKDVLPHLESVSKAERC